MDWHKISLTGESSLAVVGVLEQSIQALPPIKGFKKNNTIITHIWYDFETLVCSNDKGKVIVIKGGKQHEVIENPFIIPYDKEREELDDKD